MDRDLTRTAELLDRDVARTLGSSRRATIDAEARLVATLDRSDSDVALVEHVQQVLHDTFVNTTWPTCPRHGRHPLWYADGAWWCTEDHVVVAPLGELPASTRPAG
jgi:hypothetical protein